jgi:hypothetical protein
MPQFGVLHEDQREAVADKDSPAAPLVGLLSEPEVVGAVWRDGYRLGRSEPEELSTP